jgi:hypothetical protein
VNGAAQPSGRLGPAQSWFSVTPAIAHPSMGIVGGTVVLGSVGGGQTMSPASGVAGATSTGGQQRPAISAVDGPSMVVVLVVVVRSGQGGGQRGMVMVTVTIGGLAVASGHTMAMGAGGGVLACTARWVAHPPTAASPNTTMNATARARLGNRMNAGMTSLLSMNDKTVVAARVYSFSAYQLLRGLGRR